MARAPSGVLQVAGLRCRGILDHYEIRVSFEGFRPTTARVTVGARALLPLRVMLPLAKVKQDVTVSDQAPGVNPRAATNSGAVTVDQNLLESLPVFDQDLVATVSRFLDAASLGNGGATAFDW